jgi:soluble lytic murein transglycosylase-like protein
MRVLLALRKLLVLVFALLSAAGFCPSAAANSGEACLREAVEVYRVNPHVLRAILWNESRFNARAVNDNKNGTRDLGVGQVNTVHLPALQRSGIQPDHLMDLCTGIHVSAWLLAEKTRLYGNTWYAVGAYHSVTPALNAQYANKIKKTLAQWQLLPQPG